MPQCSLYHSNNVWFTDYRPDKIRVRCYGDFRNIQIRSNSGFHILDAAGTFTSGQWWEFDLVYPDLGNPSWGGHIERVTLDNQWSGEQGYLTDIEFGPQIPTEHPQ